MTRHLHGKWDSDLDALNARNYRPAPSSWAESAGVGALLLGLLVLLIVALGAV